MDIRYNRPGVMEVLLDDSDIARILGEEYTMCRNGLYGLNGSKTHIRLSHGDIRASLDGDADVTIWMPREQVVSLPVEFPKMAIGAFGENIDDRKNWFFGENGGIRVAHL